MALRQLKIHLYPMLAQFPEGERESVLAKARQASFDAIELQLIGRAAMLIANYGFAFCILVILSGPFYIRRTRREPGNELSPRA